jgi:uncharacterized HhH-GPD family protein
MPAPTLTLSLDPKADALLSRDPLALLIGMVLDQQVPLEKAFRGPFDLQVRLGDRQKGKKLDASALAGMDSDELTTMFVTPPALHRYPAAMAGRVQELCRIVATEYDGKADRIWRTAADGTELLARVKALPGFGEQKARIFVALLGKQVGVDVPGWREAAGPFGEEGSRVSVADITGPESLAEVRAYKQQLKAAAKAAQASKPTAKTTKAAKTTKKAKA